MIIHLSNDEKFIDDFIQNQNKYFPQVTNKYFAIAPNDTFRHIKNPKVEQFNNGLTYHKLLEQFKEKPKAFIFHNLNRHYFNLINTIPKEISIAWIFYGTEIFGRGENQDLFWGPITKKNYHPLAKVWLYRRLQYLMYYFDDKLSFRISPFLKAIHRIDYMAHWIKEDYKFIVNRYGLKKMNFIEFRYSIDMPQTDYEHRLKEDLMIGHSAAPTNNHLDIINELPKSFINHFKRIIIPLSYGGTPAYIRAVKKSASKKFGDKVIFLNTFLDKDTYFNMLSGVKLLIMAQYRSQGGSNIRFFLKNGTDLAFYEHNNMHKFYKQLGVKTHTIRSLKNNSFSFLLPKDHNRNKEITAELFQNDQIKTYYENLFFLKNSL